MPDIADRYELRGSVGRGATGAVHAAFDRILERRVAIKLFDIPPPEDTANAETLARFRVGAKAAAKLSHRNIVPVYDYGESERRAWIVMELIEGASLRELLDRGETFPLARAVDLVEQILAALDYSHANGVVHRDVKPANIMLAQDGIPRLTDFGIARLQDTSITVVGTVMGTPAYMAPEQFDGMVDRRADIWAAGVVLYQLLTGERPFEGNYATVMRRVLTADPAPATMRRAELPAATDAVITRALAKRPEDRFQSAGEFAKALAALRQAPARAAPQDATLVQPMPAIAPRAAPQAGPREVPRAEERRPAPLAAPLATPLATPLAVPREEPRPRPPLRSAPAARRRGPLLGLAGAATLSAAAVIGFLVLGAGSPLSVPAGNQPFPADAGQRDAGAPGSPAMGADAAGRGERTSSPMIAALPGAIPPVANLVPPPPTPPAAVLVPPAPPQPVPIPQPGMEPRAAALIAAEAAECGLFAPVTDGEQVVLAGVARRGEEEGVRRVLAGLGVAPSAVQVRVESFDGPFCNALAAMRPAASPHPAGPRLTLLSPQPLLEGQNLRFQLEMPDWPAFLHVLYLTSDGQAGNLVQAADAPYPRRASPQFGQPFWRSSPPWGTDLMLVVASERPLFPQRRVSERAEEAVAALSGAVRAAQQSGRRIEAWAFTHRKEPAR